MKWKQSLTGCNRIKGLTRNAWISAAPMNEWNYPFSLDTSQ